MKAQYVEKTNLVEFMCPACQIKHQIPVNKEKFRPPFWGWNENLSAPTFTPSIKVTHYRAPGGEWTDKETICHSFVTDGKISFCGDCTHEMKDVTVELPDL